MASKLLITPFNGSTTAGQDPTIKFQGTGNASDITLRVAADGNLSFEGTAGQLMSITNSMSGTIFSANDVSGIPSIEVLDTGLVKLNEFNGNLQIGGTTNTANQVTLKGTTESTSITTGSLVLSGGAAVTKNLYAGGSVVAASGTTGAGYFGLGTVLSSGAGANDTTLRWDGSSGSLRFSYGTSIVGTLSSAGALTVNGAVNGAYFSTQAVSSYGYGFWTGVPGTYGILMSPATDGTYGGRIAGETTSDYNMYFTMTQATNRGFMFRNAYATPLFAINGDGVRSNVAITSTGAITGTSHVVTSNCTLSAGTGSTTNNLNIKGSAAGATGISLYDSANAWKMQIYGDGADYGCLGSNWGAWDLRKTISGALYLNNNATYYLNPASTTNLSSLTVANTITGSVSGSAATLTTARNIGGTSFNGSANIIPQYIADSGLYRITNPGGGGSTSATSSQVGAIRISLPVAGAQNTMVRFSVKIYEYTTNESFEVHCGGYVYTGNTWANNPFAYIIGNPGIDRNFTVRFGYTAGGKMCVYIGELASSWSYPQVNVTEVQCGYSGQSTNWTTGWAIGYEASAFESVTATISNCQVGQLAVATPAALGTAAVGTSSLVARSDHVHQSPTTISGNAGSANALMSATTTVNVSAATAPSTGQVLTATSSTTATWQTAGGGVSVGDAMAYAIALG